MNLSRIFIGLLIIYFVRGAFDSDKDEDSFSESEDNVEGIFFKKEIQHSMLF